jgi:glutamate synthase domain-containing protein 2
MAVARSLDFSPAPIDVLIELRQTRPDLFEKVEVYIDGGVRRGTDVLKAIALGATAVGLGRPFLVSVERREVTASQPQAHRHSSPILSSRLVCSTHNPDTEKRGQGGLSRSCKMKSKGGCDCWV